MSEEATRLIPHLCCRNAAEAAEFYRKAFGAEVLTLQKMPDGKVMHGVLSINGATFFIVDEFAEQGALGPQSLGGSPVMLYLQVTDSDAVFQRAVEAGCEVKMPLEDMFWGDRYGSVVDPYGHYWEIATPVREASPEEIKQALASMPGSGC